MKKVILISGGSSGFGKMAALELIKSGHIVYGAARRIEQMQELIDAGGHAIKLDVTSDESVKSGVELVLKEQGRIDALINNAGYGCYDFVETADIAQMKQMYEVNIWGLVRLTQAVLPYMRMQKKGSIINISSLVGKLSMGVFGFYSSTKHAVEAISDALRQEVCKFGIDVTVIEPGVFRTGFESVVEKEMESINAGKVYFKSLENFICFFKNMYDKGATPEPVVEAIVHALISKKPKTRYKVGSDAKALIFMRKLLSDRAYDKIILKRLKI